MTFHIQNLRFLRMCVCVCVCARACQPRRVKALSQNPKLRLDIARVDVAQAVIVHRCIMFESAIKTEVVS